MKARGNEEDASARVSAGRLGIFKQMRREVKVLRARK